MQYLRASNNWGQLASLSQKVPGWGDYYQNIESQSCTGGVVWQGWWPSAEGCIWWQPHKKRARRKRTPAGLSLLPSCHLPVLSSPGAESDPKLEGMRPMWSSLLVNLPSQAESSVEQAKKGSVGWKSVIHKRVALISVSVNPGYPYQWAITLSTYNLLTSLSSKISNLHVTISSFKEVITSLVIYKWNLQIINNY